MTDLTSTPDASVGVLDPPLPVVARAAQAGEGAPTPWPPGPRRRWPIRFVRGKESDPAWVRPALLALPYYFTMINVALFFGLYHALTDRRRMSWD